MTKKDAKASFFIYTPHKNSVDSKKKRFTKDLNRFNGGVFIKYTKKN